MTVAAQAARNSGDRAPVPVKKLDGEQHLVFGEVYAPDIPDSQGDYMSREQIQAMAYEFMRKGLVDRIDVGHTREQSGCYAVESFIARDGDPVFIPGSWVLGVKIPDPDIWVMVKSGQLNGFSLDGTGVRVDTLLDVAVPDFFNGETSETDGHVHPFVVSYGLDGTFLGGRTVGPADHYHEIVRGTVTEPGAADGHTHRFSFLEGVLDASVAA